MTKNIIMPKYGLQQDNGTVVEWRVKEGDHVNKGDILLDLETDKALFEYESPESGYVRKLVAQNGEEVPVLSVIAIITDETDEAIEDQAPTSTDSPSEEPRQIADTAEREPALEAPTQRIKRSPAARRRARELNIDLASIAGTGPGGRIVLADVELAASAAPSSTTLSRMRQAIGRTMAYSKSTIPHFYVATEIDLTDAETLAQKPRRNRRHQTLCHRPSLSKPPPMPSPNTRHSTPASTEIPPLSYTTQSISASP